MAVAALIGIFVASLATVALGYLFLMAWLMGITPLGEWATALMAIPLLSFFAFVFVVVFREMRGKLTP